MSQPQPTVKPQTTQTGTPKKPTKLSIKPKPINMATWSVNPHKYL